MLIYNQFGITYSEPSYAPYSPNQFLGWDFFAASYSKTALIRRLIFFLAEEEFFVEESYCWAFDFKIL